MALFQIEEALLRSKKGSATHLSRRSPSIGGSTTPKSPTLPSPPPPKSPTHSSRRFPLTGGSTTPSL